MQGKIWGTTEEIFRNESVSIHELRIIAGGFCSEHRHESKINHFIVIDGILEIIVWTAEGIGDKTTLYSGQRMMIPPGVWHKFRAVSQTHAFEIYEVRMNEADILRRSIGGIEIEKPEREGD